MRETTIKEIVADFAPMKDADKSQKELRPVTVWIPGGAKAEWDHLQKISGRRLSKMARELLIALITAAGAKTA